MFRLLLLLVAVLMLNAPVGRAAEWRGNYFPNVVLTDQDGKKHRFYDDLLKDKIVTINFMFTTCKDICPLDTANLLRVQELLGDRVLWGEARLDFPHRSQGGCRPHHLETRDARVDTRQAAGSRYQYPAGQRKARTVDQEISL
jgi:hypothetical protein